MIALEDCIIARSSDGKVEVAEGCRAHRAFPTRVTERFGICLKMGPDHRVKADGHELLFPENAICVRPAGCVWSTEGTGPVGFLSLDIDACLLPRGIALQTMSFAKGAAVPGFASAARAVRSAHPDAIEMIVSSLLLALESAGALAADELRESAPRRTAARARAALEANVGEPLSLLELAADLGTNRFALMRDFKKQFGITPHAFLIRLRVERARERIARGVELAAAAIEVGFADQAHFNRVFKRSLGMTPGRYARSTRSRSVVVG